jgi:hypothetical protein
VFPILIDSQYADHYCGCIDRLTSGFTPGNVHAFLMFRAVLQLLESRMIFCRLITYRSSAMTGVSIERPHRTLTVTLNRFRSLGHGLYTLKTLKQKPMALTVISAGVCRAVNIMQHLSH